MKTERIGWQSALIALAVSLLWGANLVALKLGLGTFPPLWSAFWRMLAGVIVVGLWAKSRRIQLRPTSNETGSIGLLGLLFVVQITALNTGADFTSPAYAVILLNSHPIFTNLMSHFYVPEDRLSWQRIAGLAIAFGGICFLSLGRPDAHLAPHPGWGNLIVVISGFLLAVRMVYTQRLVQTMEPVRAVLWQMVVSLPFFAVMALLWEQPTLQPVTWPPVAALLYQGVVIAGLCFVVWTHLLRRHSPGTLSMFGFTVPIFGVVLSALIFGEALTVRLLAGAAAVTAGIIVVTRRARSEGLPAAAPAVNGALR